MLKGVCVLFVLLPIHSTLEGRAAQETHFEKLIVSRVVPRNEEVSDMREHHGAPMARQRVTTCVV